MVTSSLLQPIKLYSNIPSWRWKLTSYTVSLGCLPACSHLLLIYTDRCVHGACGTCLNNWDSAQRWHHDTRHTITGMSDRQPCCRWVGDLGQLTSGDQTLWNVFEKITQKAVQLMEFLIMQVFLWGAPAGFQHVKWSREIKFHQPARTWFPLSPHSLSQLLSTLDTFQELMDCSCMEEVHIIYHANTQCFCSLCLHCSHLNVRIFPWARFHLLFWGTSEWQADDMWVEKVNK